MSDDFLNSLTEEIDGNVLQNELGRYIDLLLEAEEEVKVQEEILKQKQEALRKLSAQVIPDIMTQSGIETIKTTKGTLVLKEDLQAHIPKDFFAKGEALKWLRSNNASELIKEEITINENISKETLDKLSSLGIPYNKSEEVNTNSLKAYFREVLGMKKGSTMMMNQEDIPKEFGLYVYRKVSIKK